MSLIKKLSASPSVANAEASLVRAVCRSAWGIAVPAVLSINDFGIYSILMAGIAIIAQLSVLGAPQTIMRSSIEDTPILGFAINSLILLLISSCIIYCIFPKQVLSVYLFYFLGALLTIAYSLLSARAKAHLKFRQILYAELTGNGTLIICLIFILYFSSSVTNISYVGVMVIELLSSFIILIALLFWSRPSRSELHIKNISKYLPSIFSIGFLIMFDIIIWKRIELFFLRSSPDGINGVAVFSFSAQIATIIMIIPSALIESWYPSIASYFMKDLKLYSNFVKLKIRQFTKIYILYVYGCVIVLYPFLKYLFPKYVPWLQYILILIVFRVTFGYAGLFSSILYATKREKILYLPVIGGAIIALLTNSLFTLNYGLHGVLLSYLITHGLISFATIYIYKWNTKKMIIA